MAVYALGDRVPDIHPTAYVHPLACVIGSVVLGPEASVWPFAVVRGDDNEIVVGERSNVQDGAVIHCTAELRTVLGPSVTVGHQAHIEGATIETEALIAVGSKVLHEVVVGAGAIVGANAVVTNRTVVPPRAMALGVPAKIRPDAVAAGANAWFAENYAARARRYRAELRRLD